MTSRVSRPCLERIAASLDERSWRVVRILAEHRFATTNQLARLHQSHHKTAASALRQTARLIRHLQTLSLVHHLERRIGGQRAGSTGLIWYLTEHGFRLLEINAERHTTTHHRNAEPSTRFLTHPGCDGGAGPGRGNQSTTRRETPARQHRTLVLAQPPRNTRQPRVGQARP